MSPLSENEVGVTARTATRGLSEGSFFYFFIFFKFCTLSPTAFIWINAVITLNVLWIWHGSKSKILKGNIQIGKPWGSRQQLRYYFCCRVHTGCCKLINEFAAWGCLVGQEIILPILGGGGRVERDRMDRSNIPRPFVATLLPWWGHLVSSLAGQLISQQPACKLDSSVAHFTASKLE